MSCPEARLAAIVALALTGTASGQEVTVTPVFPTGLEVVNVTLSVRDEKGRLVSNLGPDDFVVQEDGRPQKVTLFARATEPGQEESLAVDLGLLLDTSGSMAEEMKLQREAAVRFLENIPRARDLIVIFFDNDIRLSRYDNEHQQGLFERIFEAKGKGMTALYDAIAVYLSRVQDSTGGRRILVLFTDGEDSTSSVSLSEVIQLVRGAGVTMYCVAFTGSYTMGSNRFISSRGFLNELAGLTGGEVFAPHASKELSEVYAKILDELTNQYVLGFVSDNAKRDGRFRKLKVEAKAKGLRVRHRAGYLAPR